MSILVDTALDATFRNGYIIISMESGVELRFPVDRNKRLAQGTESELSNIEISPYGIHWPDLDEDLSFKGLYAGDYGQYSGTHKSRCDKSVHPRRQAA